MTRQPYITTEEDFEYWAERVHFWMAFFGLNDWQVFFHHDTDRIEGGAASGEFRDEIGHFVHFSLNPISPIEVTEDYLDGLALHGCVHLKLSNFSLLARSRFTSEDAICEAEESLVVFISNLVKGLTDIIGE